MINAPKLIVGLDFETFYAADYTLKKMSTTGYIRDPRFKVHGVGIRTSRQRIARWYTGDKIKTALAAIDWGNAALLAHHCQFDGLILIHHFGHIPAYYYCTLSMARPLHGNETRNDLDSLYRFYGGPGKHKTYLDAAKNTRDLSKEELKVLGDGCLVDIEGMWHVFNKMYDRFPRAELDLIHHTVRAYTEPVIRVDKKLARELLEKERVRREAIFKRVHKYINTEPKPETDAQLKTALRSRERFAEALRGQGCEPPMKPKKNSESGELTYAFAKADLDFQELQAHPKLSVRTLVEAKGLVSSTLAESRPARLIEHADPALPIYLAYGKAHTMRWTGGDLMNPQNFQRDSKLRNCLRAPPGFTFVVIDSGQIEDRMNCYVAGQDDIIDAYRRGEDVYKIQAAIIYNKPVADVTSAERFVGKVARLMLGYQAGRDKYDYTLKAGQLGPPVTLPSREVTRAHSMYRSSNAFITAQWAYAQQVLIPKLAYGGSPITYGPMVVSKERVDMPNGLFLRYPRVRKVRDVENPTWVNYVYNESTKIYGGSFNENFIQCLARIAVAEQIARLAEIERTVLLVHDEGVFCVRKNKAKKFKERAEKEFSVPPTWAPNLPVTGKAVISPFYLKA